MHGAKECTEPSGQSDGSSSSSSCSRSNALFSFWKLRRKGMRRALFTARISAMSAGFSGLATNTCGIHGMGKGETVIKLEVGSTGSGECR